MNPFIYSILNKYSTIIYLILICIFMFTLFNVLPETIKRKIIFYIHKILPFLKHNNKKTEDELFFHQQIKMFVSIVIVNIFAVFVYDDFAKSSLSLSIIISITQILAIIRLFISSKSNNKKSAFPLLLGFFSIIFAFTHIYFYIFVNFKTGFTNFDYLGMNSNRMDDWFNCFFYTISLIIPYSFTELLPNTYGMKFISLFQLVIFYVFIYRKLAVLFDKNKID